jgi:hypothetical protein
VRDRIDDLGGAAVALVTFTRQRNLRGYRSRLGLPFPVLADEDRSVYRAYGFGRASLLRVWSPSVLAEYGRLLRAGRRLRRPTEDTRQLGGDVVVGPDGRIAYLRRSSGPDDRPPVDELVEAVARM